MNIPPGKLRASRSTLVITAIAIQAFLFGCDHRESGRAGYPSSTPYQGVADAARQEIIENDSLRIARLELGAEDGDEYILQASATNKTGSSFLLCLDLRTEPGLWYRRNWQKQYSFEIEPRADQQIEAVYKLSRRTPESKLRVRFGGCGGDVSGSIIVEAFYERWFTIGLGRRIDWNPLSSFDTLSTDYFDVYAWKDSPAANAMEQIAAQREEGFHQISELLDVEFRDRIRLVFYPDSATKTNDTGHTGAGWASGNNIVEIYNNEIKLDPYHELAHVVAGEIGDPPAMFDEGFATYAAERLGSDALEFLDSAGKTVDEATCEFIGQGAAIPLSELFRYTDIGSLETYPQVSYPQSASLVKYLIEIYSMDQFREVYGRLKRSGEEEQISANRSILEAVFGKSLDQIEDDWLAELACR